MFLRIYYLSLCFHFVMHSDLQTWPYKEEKQHHLMQSTEKIKSSVKYLPHLKCHATKVIQVTNFDTVFLQPYPLIRSIETGGQK
jgi:hypothetical protein